jgi:hypothetical protein
VIYKKNFFFLFFLIVNKDRMPFSKLHCKQGINRKEEKGFFVRLRGREKVGMCEKGRVRKEKHVREK